MVELRGLTSGVMKKKKLIMIRGINTSVAGNLVLSVQVPYRPSCSANTAGKTSINVRNIPYIDEFIDS
jgi:hypothetical protein